MKYLNIDEETYWAWEDLWEAWEQRKPMQTTIPVTFYFRKWRK